MLTNHVQNGQILESITDYSDYLLHEEVCLRGPRFVFNNTVMQYLTSLSTDYTLVKKKKCFNGEF